MFNKEKKVQILLDKEKCIKCGACINVCMSFLEKDNDGYPVAKQPSQSKFGCVQCAHCMMKCPTGALEIVGEGINKNLLRTLSTNDNVADYKSLFNLLLKRRSIRKFKSEKVSREDINKIIDAAANSPSGFPPSEVKVLAILGDSNIQTLNKKMTKKIKQMKAFMSPFTINLMKPFIGKVQCKFFKECIIPLFKGILSASKIGQDELFYNAPAIMIFYSTDIISSEEAFMAASNAVLAAESLGYGTCYIGSVAPIFNNNLSLKRQYGLKKKEKVATAFILGRPDETYPKAIQRNFKSVNIIQ